ncbi:MAG: polysaccharide biosynthesis protein [Bacteroidales bacterium]|nr:polysaccharide biosynthesis protein [Bacteroidales bacterium]
MNIFNKISNWYFTREALPYWCVCLFDCIVVLVSGVLAHLLAWGGSFSDLLVPIGLGLLVSALVFAISFRIFHTYSGIIRFSVFVDLQQVGQANLISTLAVVLLWLLLNHLCGLDSVILPSPGCALLMFAFSTFIMWLTRITVKVFYDIFRTGNNTKNVFIYGVHAGGVALATSIQNENPLQYRVVGFVTPGEEKYSEYLMGALVRHDSPRLVQHMIDKGANVLFVSPLQSEHFRTREDLISDLLANNIKIMMYSGAEEWDGKSLTTQNLHEVEIEDLLPRNKIEVDLDSIGEMLTDKTILITGAAGSIGSEMVRQVAIFKPRKMVLVDQAETPMHDIRLMMKNHYPSFDAETIVTSITDAGHMESIFAKFRPDYVFHAAAYKHVPMMEDNPVQAVRNNILGTRIIADLALKYETKKFVMISTDKAVNPTNVMGCSKRICEIYCQSLNKAIVDGKVKGITQYVTTRFGNVLGSNGSVIPIFREQIKNGGPVTVTHKDIIRYFMLIPEACKLVLEAGTKGRGGEIFVFDMGNPVRIYDLAQRMIKLSGAQNIEIKVTGLRDGEKLYEEVLNDKEFTKPTHHPKIMVAQVREYDYAEACRNEDRLMQAAETYDDMEIVKVMKEIVPEYKSKVSKYQVLDIR